LFGEGIHQGHRSALVLDQNHRNGKAERSGQLGAQVWGAGNRQWLPQYVRDG